MKEGILLSPMIGAHLSTSQGIERAMQKLHSWGGSVLQLFSGSPRFWQRPNLAKFNVDKISTIQDRFQIKRTYIHALYLINLASDNRTIIANSKQALIQELIIASHLHSAGVIVHLGSHQGRGWRAVQSQLVSLLVEIMISTPDNSRLLIENSAGQQGKIASNLSEIRFLLDEVRSQLSQESRQRLGWCLDTCHAYSAGYFFGNGSIERSLEVKQQAKPKLYDRRSNLTEVISQLELWSDLGCVHLNDSKHPFASGKDQHENLGDGFLPFFDLKNCFTQWQWRNYDFISEAPGIDGSGPDQYNLDKMITIWSA